jgi:hypothetical protein
MSMGDSGSGHGFVLGDQRTGPLEDSSMTTVAMTAVILAGRAPSTVVLAAAR